MRTIIGGLRTDFLSYQNLLTAMFLTKEINHASTCSEYVNGVYIVKIVCDSFLP